MSSVVSPLHGAVAEALKPQWQCQKNFVGRSFFALNCHGDFFDCQQSVRSLKEKKFKTIPLTSTVAIVMEIQRVTPKMIFPGLGKSSNAYEVEDIF